MTITAPARVDRELPRLDRTTPAGSPPPLLTAAQRKVVAHCGGPLLVLAGPGTGKTTTLVETMVARLSGPQQLPADQVLGLTYGRRAAQDWREQVTARLSGGLVPTVTTFHSLAYSLVRRYCDPERADEPLRLLSGPEQEQRLRELLTHSVRDGRLHWPSQLRAALGTAGLAAEVRAVVARARALGLDPADLAAIAAESGEVGQAWAAIAQFLGEYLDVLDAEGASDYTEVIHRAGLIAQDEGVKREQHARYRVILVDEFQDTDPAQIRLLRALVGPQATLVAAGDPDQSVHAFRGADRSAVARFGELFPVMGQHLCDVGAPEVVVLGHSFRAQPALQDAAARVRPSTALAPLPAAVVRAYRASVETSTTGDEPAGEQPLAGLDVVTFDTPGAEAAHIADVLRRGHLEDGLAWADMAVIVRSSQSAMPTLRRALTAAGVPVEVGGDELPLAAQPAVVPLLQVLRSGSDLTRLDPATCLELAVSPVAGGDPSDLRRLGRELRRSASGSETLSSESMLRDLVLAFVVGDAPLLACGQRARRAARALKRLAAALRGASAASDAEDALWAVWSSTFRTNGGTGWPQRLQEQALRGGDAGTRADADLDAVVALFAAAHRLAQRRPGDDGVLNFLDELGAQQIAGDGIAPQAMRRDAVRLLTAHRAKGLQWQLVVVAGVQEGLWPDVRRRGTLLQPDRLSAAGLMDAPTPAEILAEERRLFFVAVTRAKDRLLVTAVRSGADDGLQPSRFVAEVAGDGMVRHVPGHPERALSPAALVARLRATAVDPRAPSALRDAATRRLAVVAAATRRDGRPLAPGASPDRWWGMHESTQATVPVRPESEPLALSGSQLSALCACPLRWFLDHEVRAEVARSTALAFGSVVHALADAVAREVLPADTEVLASHLDEVWSQLGFEATWQPAGERAAATAALARFVAWHSGRPDRNVLASEHSFDVLVPVGDHGVRLTGSFDRVEVDVRGAVHIVDLKTARSKVSRAELVEHPQLGVYQLAAAHGALDALQGDGAPPPQVAGAELVMLRVGSGSLPAVQGQECLSEANPWVQQSLARAEELVRSERFRPTPGDGCRSCAFRRVCPANAEGVEVMS